PAVRKGKRFRVIGTVGPPRRGCICVMKHLLATAGRTITGHSIGRTFRRSFPTHPKESLSPTAELFSSDTCRRRRHYAGKQFRSHSSRQPINIARRLSNPLPLIPQFPRRS